MEGKDGRLYLTSVASRAKTKIDSRNYEEGLNSPNLNLNSSGSLAMKRGGSASNNNFGSTTSSNIIES